MEQINIKQKMSGTGSIYDIESEHFDIVIKMGNRFNFAVVGPSYYNLGATKHIAAHSAISAKKRLDNAGYQGIVIMDKNQNQYDIDFNGELARV